MDKKRHDEQWELRDLYSNNVHEFISNIRIIKSFSNEEKALCTLKDLKFKFCCSLNIFESCLFGINNFMYISLKKIILFIAGAKSIIRGNLIWRFYNLSELFTETGKYILWSFFILQRL